jgi:hypothetical protein
MGSNLLRILILDDEKVRHDHFSVAYKGHEITHSYTYSEFISCLESGSPWDLIHLDHDLGDHEGCETYVDGWGKVQYFTGYHASERIFDLPDHKLPLEVIVHSVNPLGSRNIIYNLEARKLKPKWLPYSIKSE